MSGAIGVNDFLELYTLIFGWYMYDQVWQLMMDTGIAFLPFLMLIINNFVQPITATYTTSAAQLSLKKMEWDLIRMLVVVVLAGQPLLNIEASKLEYTKMCAAKDEHGNMIDKTGKIINPQNIRMFALSTMTNKTAVPLWWYAVYAVSTGFTEGAKRSIPCVEDARAMMVTMGGGIVTTASLDQEVLEFINTCWWPARSFVERMKTNLSLQVNRQKYGELIRKYGQDDINWPGSHVFSGMTRETGGDHFYGKRVTVNGNTTTCAAWWGTELALQAFQNLHTHPPTEIPSQLQLQLWRVMGSNQRAYALDETSISDDELEKVNKGGLAGIWTTAAATVKEVYDRSRNYTNLYPSTPTYAGVQTGIRSFLANNYMNTGELVQRSGEQGTMDYIKERMAAVGLLSQATGTFTGAYVVRESFTTVQPLLLMAVYLLIGIGLVFSGYSLEYLVAASLGLFTLKFLNFLIYFCTWIDNNLLMLLGNKDSTVWTAMTAVVDTSSFTKIVLDYSITALYFTLPSLWVAVMGWAGHNMSQTVGAYEQMGGKGSALHKAAETGAQQVQKVGVEGVSAMGKGLLGVSNSIVKKVF